MTKKRIGIDARLINQTGVGVYIKNLLCYLDKLIDDSVELYVYLRKDDFQTASFNSKNITKRQADIQWHSISEQTLFLKKLFSDRLDLMHFTYFSFPMFYPRPFIITIHDLIPLSHATGKASTKHPFYYSIKLFAYRLLLSKAVSNSKAILAPSNTVKQEITQYFGDDLSQKIYVTYEGVNMQSLQNKLSKKLEQQYKNPFYIYIGNFYPHKNVDHLIRAFAHSHTTARLVLIGPEDHFSQRMKAIIDEENAQNRITFHHNATSEDLTFFYEHAKALIHPSRAEGFGLSLIEAIYHDCPVLASNIPVFEELYKDVVIFFDQNDIYEMARVIDDFDAGNIVPPVIDKKSLLKKYSFETMSKKTLEVYNKLLAL